MKRIFFLLFTITILNACSTSEETENTEDQTQSTDDLLEEMESTNFFALEVGNSWVYKNYKFDAATNEYYDTGVIDSISVTETLTINSETFYTLKTKTTGNESQITFCNPNGDHFNNYREANGELINSDGTIVFSTTNFDEKIFDEDDSLIIYEKTIDTITSIEVESGVFDCIHKERYAKSIDGEQYPGLDYFYYAEGIGLIYDTSSFVASDTPSIIRKLDSFYIK